MEAPNPSFKRHAALPKRPTNPHPTPPVRLTWYRSFFDHFWLTSNSPLLPFLAEGCTRGRAARPTGKRIASHHVPLNSPAAQYRGDLREHIAETDEIVQPLIEKLGLKQGIPPRKDDQRIRNRRMNGR
jgi:hypothetical protein